MESTHKNNIIMVDQESTLEIVQDSQVQWLLKSHTFHAWLQLPQNMDYYKTKALNCCRWVMNSDLKVCKVS